MRIDLKMLVGPGVDDLSSQDVALLVNTDSLEVVRLILRAHRAAIRKLRAEIETRPSVDPSDPERHIYTLTGQIGALKATSEWIAEAAKLTAKERQS